MFIRLRKVRKDEAEKILQFFKDNPDRSDCIVGYDRGQEFTGTAHDHFKYTREDIPQLEKVLRAFTANKKTK